MAAKSAGDPNPVWEVFKSVFKNLMVARGPESDKYLTRISQMVTSFPQILVGTSTWPDTISELSSRRNMFTAALVRRVVQVVARRGVVKELSSCVMVIETVFSIMMDVDKRPVRWANLVTTLVDFWARLCVVSEQLYQSVDSLEAAGTDTDHSLNGQDSCSIAEGVHGIACRIMEVQQDEDEMFSGDLNFLVLNETEVLEMVQVWLTQLMTTQVALMAKYNYHQLDKVQNIAVKQLEMGEALLKRDTMKLLASLHRVGGPGTLEMWGEESMWLAGIVELLVNSEDLDRMEKDVIEEGWSEVIKSILTHINSEDEMVVLASHILPMWQELVNTGKVDRLGNKMKKLLSSLVIRVLAEKSVMNEINSSELINKAMHMQEPDLAVVAMIAWYEVVEAGVMERVVGDRGGKRRLEGEVMSQNKSMQQASPAWRTLMGYFDGKLKSMEWLGELCKMLESILVRLVRIGFKGDLEILDRNIFAQATNTVVTLLCRREGQVSLVLECLDTLIQCGHLWPGAAQFGSEIGSIQQLWAGALSMPWLGKLEQCKMVDLRLGETKDTMINTSLDNSWSSDEKNRALVLLASLPRDVCPKWRLSVAKMAWGDRREGLILALPALVASLGSGAAMLGSEVVQSVVGGETNLNLVQALTTVCARYACSLARTASTRLILEEVKDKPCHTKLTTACSQCEGWMGRVRTPAKGGSVGSKEMEPFLKLIGHQDPAIRYSLVSLLGPWSRHSTLSPDAASLWLTCVSDSEEEVRLAISSNIAHMFKSKSDTLAGQDSVTTTVVTRLCDLYSAIPPSSLDTYISTLVTATSFSLPFKSYCLLLDTLLDMFFSPSTTVNTYVRALPTLQAAMSSHKNHLVTWCAKAMCKKHNHPKQVLNYIMLLIPTEVEPKQFITNNVHHLLPPIILYSVSSSNSSTTGSDSTLEMISSYTGTKPRTMLMYHFPSLFTHLIIHSEDQQHLTRCLEFLQSRTSKDLAVMLPTNRHRVLVELLTKFNYSKSRITQALSMCAKADDLFKHPDKSKKDKKGLTLPVVAQYVAQSLMAVLSSFVTSLSHKETPQDTKLQILNSLNDMITFLGHENLVSSKYAILECIKMATSLFKESAEFQKVSINLWSSFVHSLSLSSLVEVLPQVLCGLLPHMSSSPDKVRELFKFLLDENLGQFQAQVPYLVFLPSLPQLEDIVGKVRGEGVEFKEVIMRLIHCMEHECVDVRLQTLNTLSVLMDNNMGSLQGLIVCSDRTDPVITSLVQKLMAGLSLREPDKELRALAAVCLGKIGAIDPGKLEFVVDLGGSDENIANRNKVLDIFSVGFCVELLQELVRAQASSREPFIAENCAFSIQEVLKVYEINLSSKSPDSFTWRVWRNMRDSTQEILTPLLSSMYKHEPGSKPSIQTPIYEGPYGRTYRDWLVNWTQHLLTMLYDPKTKSVFDACLPALKKDVRVAEFLLPRIVVEVLSCGGEVELHDTMLELKTVIDTQSDNSTIATPQSGGEEKVLESNLQQMVAQAIFSILDHIGAWLRTKFSTLMLATRKPESQLKPEEIQTALKKSKEYIRVKAFKDQIPHEGLANLSYQTGAFHRSAFHLDQYLKLMDISTTGSTWLSSLQRLFAALEEPDLVLGVAAVREEEPKLEDLILQHEATGNYEDALCCYERQGKTAGGDVGVNLGIIQCYLSIDRPATAASLAAGLVAKQQELAVDLAPLQADAAWQLGRWEDLDIYTNTDGEVAEEMGWQLGLGKVMMAVKKEQWRDMKDVLARLRGELVEPLSAGSLEQGAYHRGYSNIIKLSMLCEVEKLADKFLVASERDLSSSSMGSTELLSELSCRLSYTQSSFTSLEPLFRLRRAVLGLARDRMVPVNKELADRLQFEIGECWLRSTQVARESGQLQEAYSFLLEVKKSKHIEFFLETAKLSWARGKHTEAIGALSTGLADTFPQISAFLIEEKGHKGHSPALTNQLDSLSKVDRNVLCQGKLLLAKYVEEAANVSNETVMEMYQETKNLSKQNEDVFFANARSIDKQIQKFSDEMKLSQADLISHTVITYIRAMMVGPTHLHHCLPRMLSLWLDFADVVVEFTNKKGKDQLMVATVNNANKKLDTIVQAVKAWRKQIPGYYLLTALPQIVSRICHTHAGSFAMISSILAGLLVGPYGQQTFWHMVSVSKNRDVNRKNRCNEIFREAVKVKPAMEKFLKDAIALAKKMDELCDAKTEKSVKSVSLRDMLRSLPSLVNQPDFSPIMLPNQRNMVVTLPTADAIVHKHQPFPSGLVTIETIEDHVIVMPSLVQPKKITFRGSDGKLYPFLAKPKDDLRRDCRLMDLNFLLNKLFRKDSEARKRDLHIRTYTVVPTNETSGLIEWVENLKGLRPIILQLHKENGRNLNSKWCMSFNSKKEDPLEKKRKNLNRCLEEQKGAVFSQWFAKTFPDPQAWLMARMAYTRTTAVMSMMGYIIGLGDRHLENINVDTTNGHTFHVDMNCLFNKGETMEVPEVVPFRLTHNMVDAFGPLGIEGPFRISCEIALSVMRKERDVLMSVLRPFVFDPLVDWAKGSKSGGTGEGMEALKRVEERLTGNVSSNVKKDQRKKGLVNHPLSVEGQVNHVIEQATDQDNLAQMYWGWAPYL